MVGTVPLVLAPDHGIPPVSVPGYMRAQRRGDDCRRPRTTTRPPCPPGKAGCAPKAPPTAALLAKLLPRLTHGTPVQLIPQSAADRSSGRALRAARTRGHREAGQPGLTCQIPTRSPASGLPRGGLTIAHPAGSGIVRAMSGFCARASALGCQVARRARCAIEGCSERAERTYSRRANRTQASRSSHLLCIMRAWARTAR